MPVELLKHQPSLTSAQHATSLETRAAAAMEQQVNGLSQDSNLDNYIADLEDLAHLIYRYIDLRDRSEPGNLETATDPARLLQQITSNVKNLAILYTDCLGEAFSQFLQTQQEVKAQLNQYPEEIAELQRQVLHADQQIRQLNQNLATLTTAIDQQVAFDTSLKNEAQRKARRMALMEANQDYVIAANTLKTLQDNREELLIKLQFLRSRFSVLKLHMREAIARQELAIIDAA